jgi:hypothetical protein
MGSETNTIRNTAGQKLTVREEQFLRGSTFDFLYQVTNISRPRSPTFTHIRLGNFTGLTTTVGAATNVPTGFVRGTKDATSASRSLTGASVTFVFAGSGLKRGQTSKVLVIETDAREFNNCRTGPASDVNPNGTVPSSPSFKPAVTPEPSALCLLGLGGLGMVFAWVFHWRRLCISPWKA